MARGDNTGVGCKKTVRYEQGQDRLLLWNESSTLKRASAPGLLRRSLPLRFLHIDSLVEDWTVSPSRNATKDTMCKLLGCP